MTDIFTRINLVPDPWQFRVLSSKADRIIVIGGRRVGKTTAAALVALNTAISHPDSLVVLIDPNQAMSYSMRNQISAYIAKLAVPLDRSSGNGFHFSQRLAGFGSGDCGPSRNASTEFGYRRRGIDCAR